MTKILITLGLGLLCTAWAAPENEHPQPAAPAPETPVYSSNDAALEGSLISLKEQAEQGSAAAAQQVYVQYALAGHSEQARSWSTRYLENLATKAEEGDVAAMLELGVSHLRGKDYTAPDVEKGVKWLHRAMEAGDPKAAFILGDYFGKQGNAKESKEAYAKAYRHYSQEADKNSAETLYWLGFMEQNGLGTESKPAEGIAKLEKSADQGNFWALSQLFKTYALGVGTGKDMAKAISYSRRAADLNGDGLMAYATACAYLKGEGVEADEASGMNYLDKAVKANIPQAIYYKGYLLEKAGKEGEAYPLYHQGASMGQADCLVAEARYLLYGFGGMEKDESRGLSLLQSASDRWGSPRAPYELGLYYDSIGEPQLAGSWYTIASDRGVLEAFARRGLMHIDPRSGLDWSPTRTYRWWRAGSDAGDAACTLYLRLFLYVFTPLLLILVFGVPMFIVHVLNKRAERKEQEGGAE